MILAVLKVLNQESKDPVSKWYEFSQMYSPNESVELEYCLGLVESVLNFEIKVSLVSLCCLNPCNDESSLNTYLK